MSERMGAKTLPPDLILGYKPFKFSRYLLLLIALLKTIHAPKIDKPSLGDRSGTYSPFSTTTNPTFKESSILFQKLISWICVEK
jgi:hypothetical protein